MEKVERQSSTRNEAVPEMQGEVRVVTIEAGDKVILVGLDLFVRWRCGGTSWKLTLESYRNCFRQPGH